MSGERRMCSRWLNSQCTNRTIWFYLVYDAFSSCQWLSQILISYSKTDCRPLLHLSNIAFTFYFFCFSSIQWIYHIFLIWLRSKFLFTILKDQSLDISPKHKKNVFSSKKSDFLHSFYTDRAWLEGCWCPMSRMEMSLVLRFGCFQDQACFSRAWRITENKILWEMAQRKKLHTFMFSVSDLQFE